MQLRMLRRWKRKKPAPLLATSERLLRVYWATHDDVRKARRKAA